MAAFDLKEWLDEKVVPLLDRHKPLSLHSFLWNGNPPNEILVFLRTDGADEFDPLAWPRIAKALLTDEGFSFDFLREAQVVNLGGTYTTIFGGDGVPLFDKSGMASVRLYRKEEDGRHLILQLGCAYPATVSSEAGSGDGALARPARTPGLAAAEAVKAFFAQFEENPVSVCQRHVAPFGQA